MEDKSQPDILDYKFFVLMAKLNICTYLQGHILKNNAYSF